MINPIFFSQLLKRPCYGNRFLAQIGKNWHTPSLLCALAFDNVWEDRNMDTRVNTIDDPSTSDINLVNFGPSFGDEFSPGGLYAGDTR